MTHDNLRAMPTPRKHENQAQRQAAYIQRKKQARLEELNAKGLPPLPPLPTVPGTARWAALQAQAIALLTTMRDEMQNYFEDRSETWQEGERGQEMQEKIEGLEEILEALEASHDG